MPRNAVQRLLSVGFLAVGVLIVVLGVQSCRFEVLARKWPTTPGTITSSRLESRGTGRGYRVRASITYTYIVDARRYYNSRVVFGQEILSPFSDAQKTVEKYPEHATVTVSYDRLDPDRAVLEPGEFLPGFVAMGVGSLLIGVAWWGYKAGAGSRTASQ